MPTLLYVNASVLNLRATPSLTGAVLARLPRGKGVLLRDSVPPKDGWCPVQVNLVDGTVEGWASAKYLAPAATKPDYLEIAGEAPLWLAIASRELGVREYPGAAANPRIRHYHEATSLKATSDEVPWCSAFANWCMDEAGLSGTGSAAARSWLRWGVGLAEPRPGAIAVLRRGTNPAQGHVAFFLSRRGAFLELLGGNQGNQVRVSSYPGRLLLGYRWPAVSSSASSLNK
jgi:uncharacterized protein (TIGR02594 family)